MVQLAWFALPCSILFLISLISFNYWLSLAVGSLDAFLIIALCIKIDKINKKEIDPTGITMKIAEID